MPFLREMDTKATLETDLKPYFLINEQRMEISLQHMTFQVSSSTRVSLHSYFHLQG